MKNNFLKVRIILIALIFINAQNIFAQSNGSFENGLSNWIINGHVSIDSLNAKDGKQCARISANGSTFQKINVLPFSILQFEMWVKCSDSLAKAYSFIKFYNSKNKLLLTYKSGAISSPKYVQTGNYTEAPPFTKYATIGIERDSSAGFAFVDSFTVLPNIVTKHKPACNPDEYMKPFWKGNIVYNETVLMYSENGGAANGRLLFMPEKIISLKSFDLINEYKNGIDYTVKDNIITRTADSKMTFRADTSFDTKNNLAWYNLQSQWIVVTYTHKDKWSGPVATCKGNLVPITISKLQSKSPVKIIAYGMSITRGYDASGYDTVAPYMPSYVDLCAHQLKKLYGNNNITMYNAGLPGSIVSWGADYAGAYINPLKPDLVIIDFGMNDFWRYTPEEFKGYIETIIRKVKSKNANAEFLLLSNMDFDPAYIQDSDRNKKFYTDNMQGYKKVLAAMETKGIINLDMTTLSDIIYQKKKAKDCIANPLHPNDYLVRWYAQSMVALFTNKQKKYYR
jgi:GDSL-like lipase/acylhydrolase family protein